jgi:hypothetical protein
MGNDQRSDSRTILDQVFWAGVAPPSQADVQPPAKDAPHEPAAVLLTQASPPPVEPEQVLDTNNRIQPEAIACEDAAPVEISAAADRHEPKADVSEPEPAQEIASISSPAVQPTLIDADVARQQLLIMLQGATASEETPPADSRAAADRHEPKAEASEPGPAQEIPTISSPAVQPALIKDVDVAHEQFRIMLQGATAGEEAPPTDSSAAADADTGEREPAHQPVRVELQDVLKNTSLNDKRRGEIAELMETLRRNLDKIEQHGQRADALLKKMQMHSREALVNIGPPASAPLPDESLSYPVDARRSA